MTNRILRLAAALAIGAAAPALAQSQNNNNGILDGLNRALGNDSQRPTESDRRARDDRTYDQRDERPASGSSSQGLRRLSDQELRDQYRRVRQDQQEIDRERTAIEDELGRRDIRR